MSHVILGGAGFIGSNLTRNLVAAGEQVVVLDNLSNSSLASLPDGNTKNYRFLNLDLSKPWQTDQIRGLRDLILDRPTVWHLAANSDIQKGTLNLRVDLFSTLATTISALELSAALDASQFIFASSSAVYGDHGSKKLKETESDLRPISNYGVMKLASEYLVSNIATSQPNTKYRIYRFPNVIGLPLTHGVIKDFYSRLRSKPTFLQVLGDGNQRKPFMHVEDLLNNILKLNATSENLEVFNLAPEDTGVLISDVAQLLISAFSPETTCEFGSSPQGWVGDVPRYSFDTSKAKDFGANFSATSMDAVNRVILELRNFL
jgi:UDP-glucose 4-epimerase